MDEETNLKTVLHTIDMDEETNLKTVLRIMDLAERVEDMLNECPHDIDQATVPKEYGKTPEEIEQIKEQQEVYQYSIAYKRVKNIRYLLKKLNTRTLTNLADKVKTT